MVYKAPNRYSVLQLAGHCGAAHQRGQEHHQVDPVIVIAWVIVAFFPVFALIAMKKVTIRQRSWVVALCALTYPLYRGCAILDPIALCGPSRFVFGQRKFSLPQGGYIEEVSYS